ncbi:tyrosine-type recombinase/integrase [Halogeometricum limi]|uniref:Phage integrase family protein n=1 Tax=Halogeometricum limi TaxID=555875 RepID=A0A1I6H6E2_9EURY|nr:tyrosine-type recombinase/integrase [Halogeometricum limi]SFR50045.1 Phage integrase family protein [Halogeometricum limi]
MVDINDPKGYEDKKEKALSLLKQAEIDDRDKQAILALYGLRETTGGYEPSTQKTLLTNLKRVAELTEKPITEWEHTPYHSDHTEFFQGISDGSNPNAPDGGYSDSYVGNLRRSVSVFLNHLGREWNEDIKVGQPSDGKITEEDCFTSDETSRLFAMTDGRDSAIIAMWLATGQRLAAMASIRAEDVTINGNRGGFHLNPKAIGLKGAEGYRPLLWSAPYIGRWLDQHPTYPDVDPDAALFVCARSGPEYDLGDPLGPSGFTKLLKRACERAGINQSKAQTHRLRHTAIRRMIRDGLSDQWIKYMVGWSEDSPQLQRYGSLRDKTKARDIEAHYGLNPEDDEDDHQLFENCPACGTPISELIKASYCPSCGLALSHDTERMEAEIENRLWISKK